MEIKAENFPRVKACLLKATEDRIAILADASSDGLASTTTSGPIICRDPALAIADKDANTLFIAPIARLKQIVSGADGDNHLLLPLSTAVSAPRRGSSRAS